MMLHALRQMLEIGSNCQSSFHRVITLEEELRRLQSRAPDGTGSVAHRHFPVATMRDELEDGARMENAKQLLGAYRLLLTAELLFEPPPAGVDVATYQTRLRVLGGPAASAGRPLLLPKLNDLDFRELRRLLHLSTRLMVRRHAHFFIILLLCNLILIRSSSCRCGLWCVLCRIRG